MAAQTWTSIMNACIVACSQGQSPYNTPAIIAGMPDFVQTQFPMAMSYAENRAYRDLTLLGTRSTNIVLGQALVTATGSRNVAIPQPPAWATPIIVPEGFVLISPVGTTNPALGERYSFDVASLDVIDLIWPTEGTTLDPSLANDIGRFWALRDDHTVVYAPTAPGVFSVELTGLYQPTPISATNPSTYLSNFYGELYVDLGMIYLAGALLRNFGASSEDPRLALSWSAQYDKDMPIARNEEYRRRGLAVPNVAAAPPKLPN